MSRRSAIQLGTLAAIAPAACGDDTSGSEAGSGTTSGNGGGGADPGIGGMVGGGGAPGVGGGQPQMCVLTPQQTEGPFFLGGDLERQDITEGKPGIALRVVIDVFALPDCAPVSGAGVDIWHCDAAGVYSGYPNQLGGLDTTGQTFLRGTQVSDAEGRVSFVSIYPGWYPGRAVHIHFKVRLSNNTEVTSQMYFPDADNAAILALPPYDAHGQPDNLNADDGVFASSPLIVALTPDGNGWLATLTVGLAGS
jgi:hypothetical protein